MADKKLLKVAPKFYCEKCDYGSSKQSSWDKHLLSLKHQMADKCLQKVAESCHICECGKEYKHRQSLSKHKKNCFECKKEEDITNKELIMMLVKENKEIKDTLVEIAKNGHCTNNITMTNSNNNTINKTFNLNFFLNEECKNAINISDFVNSIQIQLSDLEKMGQIGYVEGISNIIVNNLKGLDVNQRPIHCTDVKREVLYIKDADKWEKENDDKNKMRKVIKTVASKNQKLIPQFRAKHPDCNQSDSLFSDQYNMIIMESMSNDSHNEDKIIKNISNITIIEK
jgi:hypothetical protein